MGGLERGMMGALATAMNAMSGGLERRMMGALTTAMRRTHITNSSSRRPLAIILRCPSRCYVLHLDT